MVTFVLDGQAEAAVPWVEPEAPDITFVPTIGAWTPVEAAEPATPHDAANVGPDTPIAAAAMSAATAVGLRLAENLEASVRIGASPLRRIPGGLE
jgi:hypothetical protein